jgi:molybdopterin/thiamine biosynthesis adenylyltransferase
VKHVAVIGVGGLGAPVCWALARAGVGALTIIDDDVVDATNLHRQILFREEDVGRHKIEATVDALRRLSKTIEIVPVRARLTPANVEVLSRADVVVECSDRYAVKFLAADAAKLLRKPIVHGAAIRWIGTAMATSAEGKPCYRCLFEDLPDGAQQSCDVSGVVGPVCGIVGALQADLALRILDGERPFGEIASLDARRESIKYTAFRARSSCPLCGDAPSIDRIEPARYLSARDCQEQAPWP